MGRGARTDDNPEPALVSLGGATRAGDPLSLNRAPAPDLAPWIARVMSAQVIVPSGQTISCGMFNDTANVRVIISGRWTADTADGTHVYNADGQRQAMFFGPHSRRMPITVDGSFSVVGITLRPGTEHVMGGPDARRTLDLIFDHDEIVGHGRLGERFDPGLSLESWALTFEDIVRRLIMRDALRPPDALTRAFDGQAFAAPDAPVAQFAARHGVSLRTLERVIKRDFGLTPKQVLRRARALDMASQLLGVAAPDEADALVLRFFDQSHLIREIIHYFGMTPQQLVQRRNPLLRITLEGRQARRLEELERLAPGAAKPWRESIEQA